nr:MAG TPA: hypothetical protein [Caudoviricetes sp.]
MSNFIRNHHSDTSLAWRSLCVKTKLNLLL